MERSVNTSGVKVGMVGRGVGEGKVGKGVVVGNDTVRRGKNIGVAVAVGMARCVSANAVLTVDMAGCLHDIFLTQRGCRYEAVTGDQYGSQE